MGTQTLWSPATSQAEGWEAQREVSEMVHSPQTCLSRSHIGPEVELAQSASVWQQAAFGSGLVSEA